MVNLHGHFIKKCKYCSIILSQCRCFSDDKTIEYATCGNCTEVEAEDLKKQIQQLRVCQDFKKSHGSKLLETNKELLSMIDDLTEEMARLRDEVDELEEYKSMYEGLCK